MPVRHIGQMKAQAAQQFFGHAAQLLRMLTWMTEGYMNEKQRAGVPLRLEDILADYSGWEKMFRKIAYKEEYL